MKTGVSYFSSRDLRHVRQDLQEMADIGCSYVVHCYTETDLAHYRETMSAIAAATHERGMEVWFDPWGLAGIFSGETLSAFPSAHPEAWQVLSDGRRVGHACPNHPATRAFLHQWIDAAAAAGGDVLFWDEPHFYAGLFVQDFAPAWACHCETCLVLFRDQFGGDLPHDFTPQIKQFREDVLIDLLTELCRYGHEKGMRNALCPVPTDLEAHGFAVPAERLRSLVQSSASGAPDSAVDALLHIGIGDFARCAAIPDLDIFGTDPYWYLFGVDPEEFMRTYGRAAAEACREHGRELQLWLQAFRVPAGREEELRTGVRVAEEVGASYLAAWSFRATESMSRIACKDGERVWSIIGEEFQRLRLRAAI
ncbi:MAG: hypothetical protein ABIP58_05040 [Dehalococcoidia bacterium]